MKIKPIPTVLSLIITLLVLFGCWFGYQWMQVKKPLEQLLQQQPKISDYAIEVTPRKVSIDLHVKPSFSLSDDYLPLMERVKKVSGRNSVSMTIKGSPDKRLQRSWSQLYFILAEGIANHEYYQMEQQLDKQSVAKDVRVQVALDEHNVYVLISDRDGTSSLFRALPLDDGEKEVKAYG